MRYCHLLKETLEVIAGEIANGEKFSLGGIEVSFELRLRDNLVESGRRGRCPGGGRPWFEAYQVRSLLRRFEFTFA
jgi:hypothetical protein